LVFSRGESPYDFPFTVYKLDWQFARFRKIGPVPPCLPRGPFAADDKRAREDSLTWRGDFFSRWLKRENAISKEHSLREFPRCFQPSDEKSNVGQRKESPVARRIIRPAPVSVSKISEGTLIFFGGSLFSTLFRSAPTQHDMPCPMCASALVANILGASAVGTAGGVAALKMKDKARKVKSSKPKPKPKAK